MRLALLPLVPLVLSAVVASCRCDDRPSPATDGDSAALGKPEQAEPSDPGEQVVCPVCGLRFGAEETVAKHEHGGQTYHFLLADHREAFAADPLSFLEKPRTEDTTLPQDAGNK
jgi:YHS domain-containing protein